METCQKTPPGEEVSPSEIAAVEAALRHLDTQQQHRNRRLILSQIAQWFLVLKMYKELEVNYAKAKDRKRVEDKHRALLSTLMGFGSFLVIESESIPDNELDLISTSKDSLKANVRYLREKYEQWFVEVDQNEIDRVWGKLMDEREVNS